VYAACEKFARQVYRDFVDLCVKGQSKTAILYAIFVHHAHKTQFRALANRSQRMWACVSMKELNLIGPHRKVD
jgi:hypothetical protein